MPQVITKVLRFRLAATVVSIAMIEGVAQIGFMSIDQDDINPEPAYSGKLSAEHREIIRTRILQAATEYTDYSPELGWAIKPSGRVGLYHSNSDAIRAEREYATRPDASVIRIAAFGDSYTHGDDVANEHTWAAQLESKSPRLEVLNFGVGGYGTDQALLRYEREGRRFSPHICLLGFRPENINRLVNVFRPFYNPGTGVVMSKPRFQLRDGRLSLLANPLPTREAYGALLADTANEIARLGQHDYHYQRSNHRRPGDQIAAVKLTRLVAHAVAFRWGGSDRIEVDGRFNIRSEAFEILSGILVRFRDVALESGTRPIVVVLPDDDDIANHRDGKPKVYEPLLLFSKERAIEVIDLMDAFDTYAKDKPLADYFDGHYNALGNSIVSRYIHDYLVAQRVLPDSTASTAAPQ